VAFADGSFVYHGISTFTGTVAGCGTGTIVFRLDGAGFMVDDRAMITRDHLEAMFGKGTLPVHASLDSSGGPGLTLSYTGTYQCDKAS
jgi:hypothetical protein